MIVVPNGIVLTDQVYIDINDTVVFVSDLLESRVADRRYYPWRP